MKCPKCKSAETKVVDKRNYELYIRRRRECKQCMARWTTDERKIGYVKLAEDDH